MKADWRRIEEVFLKALEQPADHRAAFVEGACAGDPDLHEEVLAMLRSHEETADFLETPAYETNAELLVDQTGSLKIGERLGDYRILSLLGEGGMGEVYLADDLSLGRKVALKLVRPGFGGTNLLRQFQREERILAGLTHPNIAQLHGAGVTATGMPYFVMEYVEGERLDSFCQTRGLSLRDRLDLFRKICAAVSYAHRHLVIHRDLKPANIRVTREGEPKLLDFGIAKLLEDEGAVILEQTLTMTNAMTPDYASPEQLRCEPMTTATDVYSLGVILFELLTGQKPYRTKSRRIDEIARTIIEQEATKPSSALARAQSKIEIRNSKFLKGDLDNIVLTAIRKEPARRYSSVGQFSEDIRRHLDGLPIVARKDTVGYRATKFIQRNRIAVSGVAIVVLAIIAGLIVSLWEANRARQERDVAQRINTFLQDLLGAAAPQIKGVDVKVADLLNDASIRAKSELASQPEVMADVLLTLGRTYISLTEPEKAETDLRAGLEASLKAHGELHPTTAATMGWLGLALAYRGKTEEGEKISRKAVELQRRLHPQGHEDLGVALYALGSNLITKNEPKAAEPILLEAVEMIRKHLGEADGYYMASLTMLARANDVAGETELAEARYRQSIDVGSRVPARYRIFTAQAQAFLGLLLSNKGSYDEAASMLQQSQALYGEIFGGDENYNVGFVTAQLGFVHFLQGDYALSEAESRKSMDTLRKILGPENATTLSAQVTLGLSLTRLDRATEGEPYLREALALREKVAPKGDFSIAHTSSVLGECLTAQKRFEEAEPLLVESYNNLKAKLGDQNWRAIAARQRLAKLYDDWGKPDQAAQFR